MSKFIKYALAVATLLIACATFAFAADEPIVALVNGQPYSSLSDALSSSVDGDLVRVISSTSFDGSLVVPSGVTLFIPSSVSLTTNSGYFTIQGRASIYGDIQRLSGDSHALITISSTGYVDIYGDMISNGSGLVVNASSSGSRGNIYGGIFSSSSQAIYAAAGSSLRVYGGEFYGVGYNPLGSNVITPVGRRPVHISSDGVWSQVVSFGGLYEISQIVSECLTWISLFCAAIVANKLLLIFIIFVFGFVGLGLIKRIINN